MASLNPTLIEGGSLISSIQNDDVVALDYHQLLFNFLRLLRFDSVSMSSKYRMKFDKDLFKLPNPKAFQLICHFLFHKLDRQKAAEVFRDVWPIVDKKQEAQFRKKVQQWFNQIQEANKNFLFPHINLSIFLSPGGDKFAQLMCALSSHILHLKPKNYPSLLPRNFTSKSTLGQQFHIQIVKGNLLVDIQQWTKLTTDFQMQYHQQKQISRELLSRYRELCLKKQKAAMKLQMSLEQASFSDSQKQSMLDVNNNISCQELASEIQNRQNHLNKLMRGLLVHEETFLRASDIIHSVLHMKKSRPVLNGKLILSQFPIEFIERYQNIHSGTELELQYKDSCLNFSPLLNLVLFATQTASGLTNSLNFPSIKDQLEKLFSQKAVVLSRRTVVDKLLERWTEIFNQQSEKINRLLVPKIEKVPMSLQSITPCRNLLSVGNGIGSQHENKTPTVLRAALRLTPAELGAKSRFRPKESIDQGPLCHILPRDDHLRSSGKAFCNRSVNRRSYEVENSPFQNGTCRELKRKTSLTPDPSRRSLGKTPTSAFHSRLSRGNAASPILERLAQARTASPFNKASFNSPKSTPLKLGGTTPMLKSYPLENQRAIPNEVLERAAEAIVYDLVNLDSPVASKGCVIDPNSSFENNAFLSRNMIGRSPEAPTSNVDLLTILENSFGSPRRSSLPSSIHRATEEQHHPSNTVNGGGTLNEDHLQFEEEKGLLDASSASLIDDLLDFSLNMI